VEGTGRVVNVRGLDGMMADRRIVGQDHRHGGRGWCSMATTGVA